MKAAWDELDRQKQRRRQNVAHGLLQRLRSLHNTTFHTPRESQKEVADQETDGTPFVTLYITSSTSSYIRV